MVQPQYSPQEALERVKLMMKYDTSKTLNENVSVIFEQDSNVANDIKTIQDEVESLFSDEQIIVDIIKKYNNKSSFQNLLTQYKSFTGVDLGVDIAKALTPERDKTELDDLTKHFSSFGITLIPGGPNNRIITFDGLSKTDGTKNPKVNPVKPPPELKDVKVFQDWLDVNAKGWATGYKDGIINKGQNGRGYGNFGPRTQKAWATYKDQYLKGDTAAGTPASGTPAAGTPAAGTPAAGTPAAGTPAAGTPAAGTPAAGTTPEIDGEVITIDGTKEDF